MKIYDGSERSIVSVLATEHKVVLKLPLGVFSLLSLSVQDPFRILRFIMVSDLWDSICFLVERIPRSWH